MKSPCATVPSRSHVIDVWSHRLAWPRTEPSQGLNTGSNPVGTTISLASSSFSLLPSLPLSLSHIVTPSPPVHAAVAVPARRSISTYPDGDGRLHVFRLLSVVLRLCCRLTVPTRGPAARLVRARPVRLSSVLVARPSRPLAWFRGPFAVPCPCLAAAPCFVCFALKLPSHASFPN